MPRKHDKPVPGDFLSTLAFAFIDPFFFIAISSPSPSSPLSGYLYGNAGGAWDNAKSSLKQNSTPRAQNCMQPR